MASGGQDEAILSSNTLPITRFNSYISSVCFLVLENETDDERKATGFLAKFKLNGIDKIVIVMSNHFIDTKEQARMVIATFKFDGGDNYKIVKLKPEIFFRTNEQLDYTFVGTAQQDVDELRENHGVIPVKLVQTKLAVNVNESVVFIPQHPKGKPLRFAHSPVSKITESEVFYKADTSFGSSGSPVLCTQNNDLFVLALHKSGGVSLPDGRLANKGILMCSILSHICEQVNSERPSSVNDREASLDGNQEAGMHVDVSTTEQGRPVVQSQSAGDTNLGVDASHLSSPGSNLVHDSGNPPSKPLHVENPTASFTQLNVNNQPQRDYPRNLPAPAVCLLPFDSRELTRIAQRIGTAWRMVAKLTNVFKPWELENISGNSSLLRVEDKADRMLTGYKSRMGTRGVLSDAIKEAGYFDVAAKVRSGFYIDNID